MFSTTRCPIALVLSVALILSSGGCATLVGAGIGAMSDQQKPHGPVPRERWNRLEPGREVEVTRRDGTRFRVLPGPDSTLGSLPPEEIAAVKIPTSHKGLLVGTAIGAGIDVVTFAIAFLALSQADLFGDGGW